ncbi:sugar nucleotide-binding protein [Marinomonas sp. C2222]|uniref:dTDP-4-dehydrorhamnose reductase n=1 Tax=Marinomonas sargassi TaxID=2984494 RepID=A0ABT2YP15_9GAMM|nr:sugar nucleotide-binding protein [Marinomonas sargassi]MCV2401444.1 sugar nucleotide-binding protein [Marinomonas sargassi]
MENINAPIRILLLGSNTEVGSSLLELGKERSEFEWLCPDESVLQGDNAKAHLQEMQFDVAIDALSIRSALQNDFREYQSTLAYLSEESDAPLIMISSARVFLGDKTVAYSEDDIPDGTSPYALALVEAESIVVKNPKNIVLRTGWLFSGKGDDFVCRTLELIEDGVNLAYKDDLIGSPTPVSDLARVIFSVINQGHYGAENTGVYHYCGAEEISWVGLVEAIVATSSQLRPDVQQEIEVISETDFETVERQRQSLSCRRIFNHFGVKQRPWRSKLRNLVKELHRNKS